jgi:hypothetical protein
MTHKWPDPNTLEPFNNGSIHLIYLDPKKKKIYVFNSFDLIQYKSYVSFESFQTVF